MASVTFKAATNKRLDIAPFDFEPSDEEWNERDPFRVRHLIAKLVHESVRDFHLREKDRKLPFLTQSKLEDSVAKGKVGSARDEQQEVNLEDAISNALLAFQDGLYLLFIDDHEKRSLDDLVYLEPDTSITIIRLTALAGY